jgi:ribosome maturation factor RimP
MPFLHSPSDPSLRPEAASPEARARVGVRELAGPLCLAHGVVLVDVAWATERGARILRVTIERLTHDGKGRTPEEGWGVALDHCADLSRDLSEALDRDDVVPGAYNLEVSSPGLERELTSPADLQRFVGRLAKVKLSRPAPDGQRALRGALVSVAPSSSEPSEALLTMRVDNKNVTVPVSDVAHANLVFELSATLSKEGPSRSGPSKRGQARSAPAKGAPSKRAPARPAGGRQEEPRSSGRGQRERIMKAVSSSMGSELNLESTIEQVAKEKGIEKKVLVETIEAAILKAAQSVFGPTPRAGGPLQRGQSGQVDLFQYMTVVEEVAEPEREISLAT